MDILIVNDLATGGGVERILHDLIAALLGTTNNITVLCTHSRKSMMRQVFPERVKLISHAPLMQAYTRTPFARVINKLSKIWHMYRTGRNEWDVILALKEGPPMQLASELKARKKIAWVHVDYRYLYWTKHLFPSAAAEREVMQQFESIVCVSQAAADSICTTIGDPGNLCVRYNPLRVTEIRRKSEIETLLPAVQKGPLFVAVGRLCEQKNFQMLISCAIELLKDYEFKLHIIGDGPLRSTLQKQIDSHNVNQHISLLGNKENPYPYIKQADWFVSPAIWESYGLAIQEALILGVPVITTLCPAIEEVCDKRFCLLCENNLSSLQQTMLTVLKHPKLRDQYTDNINRFYPNETELYHNRIHAITQLWNQDEEKD